ncbi:MAG TPA: cytochrome c [Chloroflexota bacterium]
MSGRRVLNGRFDHGRRRVPPGLARVGAALLLGFALLGSGCAGPAAPASPTAPPPTAPPATATTPPSPTAAPSPTGVPPTATAPPPTAPPATPTTARPAATSAAGASGGQRANAAQVAAGEQVFARVCSGCHGQMGEGRRGPRLIGEGALQHHGDAGRLYNFVRQAMPFNAPGSLSDQEYLDVVAFLLERNGYNPNGTVVTAESAATLPLR